MEETEKIKRKLEEELEEVKSKIVLFAHQMINSWNSIDYPDLDNEVIMLGTIALCSTDLELHPSSSGT